MCTKLINLNRIKLLHWKKERGRDGRPKAAAYRTKKGIAWNLKNRIRRRERLSFFLYSFFVYKCELELLIQNIMTEQCDSLRSHYYCFNYLVCVSLSVCANALCFCCCYFKSTIIYVFAKGVLIQNVTNFIPTHIHTQTQNVATSCESDERTMENTL